MEPDSAPTPNQMQTESLYSCPNTASPMPLNSLTSTPRFGTVTPNRVFVGGIDFKAEDLLSGDSDEEEEE